MSRNIPFSLEVCLIGVRFIEKSSRLHNIRILVLNCIHSKELISMVKLALSLILPFSMENQVKKTLQKKVPDKCQ